MAASAILAIKILADASQASKGLDESATKTSKWSSGLSAASKVATVGLAAVGAVMVSGVKAAAEDAQAQAILAKALENSAGATKAQVKTTEDWITKTSLATGVADDDLRPALGNLVRATGDVAESQKAMQLALDISAATGKDVTTVSAALAKGYGGTTTALGRLVPGLDKATVASGDMAAISAELSSKVGGSAAASAATAAGQFQIFQVALAETKEGIGAALLPILNTLMGTLSGLASTMSQHTGVVTIAIGVFAALAAIVVTVNAITKVWTTIQTVASTATKVWTEANKLLAKSMIPTPILIAIAVIGLLIAAVVLAYQHSETFRRIVDAAFRAVKTAAQFAWDWIKNNWPLLLAIITGPIGLAVLAVAKHWDDIKTGAGKVISWFKSSWDAIKDIIVAPFTAAWTLIQGIIDKIRGAVSAVTDAIKKIPVPKMPDLNPFTAMAPGGAVVAGASATFRGVARAPAAGRGTASGGGTTININGALDPEGVARQVRRLLGAHDVRVGRAAVVAP